MNGQADSTFGAVSITPASGTQRRSATAYVLVVLFAVVALASFKSGAYLGAALCARGALLSAPPVRERLCDSAEQAALGYNVMTVGLAGLLLVGLDVLGGYGQGEVPVASVPMAAAQAESLTQVAVHGANARAGVQTEPEFLEIEQRKYGQLAGLPVQILHSTGGFLHDTLWSERGSECLLTLSADLIEQNDQHFRDSLRACMQQAQQACSVIPAPGSTSDVRSESAIRAIGAQCGAMRSQAASMGL